MGLFRKRSPDEIWGIDRDSPKLQPINGVSLETYVQVSATPRAGRSNVAAEDAARAGVSRQDWIEAAASWQLRIASNRMVAAAEQLIWDPSARPGRTYGV